MKRRGFLTKLGLGIVAAPSVAQAVVETEHPTITYLRKLSSTAWGQFPVWDGRFTVGKASKGPVTIGDVTIQPGETVNFHRPSPYTAKEVGEIH